MGKWLRVRAAAVAAAGLAATLTLVACSGDDPPAQPDPPEPSASSTSSAPTDDPTDEPTQEPIAEPELPEAATKPTRRGAEAFVEYYVELLNYTNLTGDATGMRAMSRNCQGCIVFVDLFEATYDAGGSFTGFRWTFRNLITYEVRREFYSLAGIQNSKGTYIKRAGANPKNFPAEEYDYRFVPIWFKGGWVMTEMVRTDV